MNRKINILIMSVLVVSMVFVMVPQTAHAQTRPTIKIGALGPLAIPVGDDLKHGSQLAVDEINAGAGVMVGTTAKNFELLTATTSGSDGLPDATAGVTNYVSLAADGVVAMIGGFRTEVVLGLQISAGGINDTKIPFLGVGSTAPIVTEYYYRIAPVNGSELTRNLLGLYITNLGPLHGVQNVTIVREDAAWSAAISGALQFYLPLLGKMTVDTSIAAIPESATGSEIATALNSLTTNTVIDAIITLFSAPVGKAVTEQWAALGLNNKMFLAGINVAAQDSKYFVDTGGAAAGEIAVSSAPPDANPTTTTAAFKTAYVKKYKEQPTYTAFAAYDAVYVLKAAIEAGDDDSAAGIHAALPDTDYLGTTARIAFTKESVAAQTASSSVPASIKAYNTSKAEMHDLYTTSHITVAGWPYAQPYFGQWRENDTQNAVWGGYGVTGFGAIQDPPYKVPAAIISSLLNTDKSDEGLFPGFEFLLSLIATTMMISVYNIRRRMRKD